MDRGDGGGRTQAHGRWLDGARPQLVSLLLRQYIRVHRLDEPMEDAPSDRYVQFDEHYLLEFIRHDAIQAHILEFLEEAFERDYKHFTGLMEEIYWGVEAELEEEAYQFRIARLADRGFPDYFEAQGVSGYLDPRRLRLAIESATCRTRTSACRGRRIALADDVAGDDRWRRSTYVQRGLDGRIAAQGKRQLRSEMAMVTNQVLIARAIDFGDLEAVSSGGRMTHNYMNSPSSISPAATSIPPMGICATHLQLLFRLGVSLTIDCRTPASGNGNAFGALRRNSRRAKFPTCGFALPRSADRVPAAPAAVPRPLDYSGAVVVVTSAP